MVCTKRRIAIWITFSLLLFVAIGGLSYYIWYVTYYKYNIADHVHSIRFSNSNYEIRVIWRRADWECWTEIYKDKKYLRHGVDLGRWWHSNELSNSVILTSGSGTEMLISVDEDSPNLSSIVLSNGFGSICVYLDPNNIHWYGGPQDPHQLYPVQKLIYQNISLVTTEKRRVVERYWVASDGYFVLVDYHTKLFVDSVVDSSNDLLTSRLCLGYTPSNEKNYIGFGSNAKATHLHIVNKYLGKPQSVPNERMIRYPIWNTKVRFSNSINDAIIRNYAHEVIENNFQPSIIDIDGKWENCQGSLSFNTEKFPDMILLTTELQRQGFDVRLSVHPFIDSSCEPFFSEAMDNYFLVPTSSHVDFTNPEAVAWFSNRLKLIQENYGIDSFKFDFGESSWLPLNPRLQGDYSLWPNLITQSYVTLASSFGDMTSVSTAWASQNVSVLLRMSDFDSQWESLKMLIPRLFQVNMSGYGFIQTDIIGGNQIHNDKELFIRWLQASVFMPSIQLSLAPWNFDQETVTIARNILGLHERYTNLILERLNLCVANGDPVNPPIWWLDPHDVIAQYIDDEFLLGETILVAPVLEEGATKRDIYLPDGEWKDGNNGNSIIGRKWIRDYPVPLYMIPYFIKMA